MKDLLLAKISQWAGFTFLPKAIDTDQVFVTVVFEALASEQQCRSSGHAGAR